MPFTYLNTDGTRVGDSGRTVNPLQTPEVTFNNMGWTFVNNDSATPAVGDIVRSSGQNFGAVLAQADSAAHSTGVLGVWDSSPAPGRTGAIKNNDTVEVNCTETVDPGDALYLSAVTAGKATKTAPAYPVFIGNCIATRVVGDLTKATVFWEGVKNELTSAQVAAAAALAAGTATLDSVVDSATRKAVTATESTAVAALAGLAANTTPAKQSDGTLIGLSTLTMRTIACPPFTAGAASVAMGTNKVSVCEIESARTLAVNSALTLSATDARTGFYYVVCRALVLGYTLDIINGGPGAGTLVTVAASLTVPDAHLFWFDGTNFYYQYPIYVEAIG